MFSSFAKPRRNLNLDVYVHTRGTGEIQTHRISVRKKYGSRISNLKKRFQLAVVNIWYWAVPVRECGKAVPSGGATALRTGAHRPQRGQQVQVHSRAVQRFARAHLPAIGCSGVAGAGVLPRRRVRTAVFNNIDMYSTYIYMYIYIYIYVCIHNCYYGGGEIIFPWIDPLIHPVE